MIKLDNQTPPPPLAKAIDIGRSVRNGWIYMGTFQPLPNVNVVMDIYAANDHLRDDKGKVMLLTFGTWHGRDNSPFGECMTEIAARNGGRSYGVEGRLRGDMAIGTYNDGDLFLPPREFLNGKDMDGNLVRPSNLFDLLGSVGAFSHIKENVRSGSRDEKWVLSGTMHPSNDRLPYHINLTNGDDYWPDKGNPQSPVVPFCAVRRLSAIEL